MQLPAHSLSNTEVLKAMDASSHGLTQQEAHDRLQKYGANTLPAGKSPGLLSIFLNQFKSPLIYVLLAAAIMSFIIHEWSDAGFIVAVLLINAIIGTIQEFSAQKSASALQQMVTTLCRVLRDAEEYELNADQLVPGDIILLESGDRIPADIRLLSCQELETSEAALTGESLPVRKQAKTVLHESTVLADRTNMVFAGTLVDRGRASGVVVATALNTELGGIASAVISGPLTKAPLMIRMERFTHLITIIIGIVALLLALIAFMQGL